MPSTRAIATGATIAAVITTGAFSLRARSYGRVRRELRKPFLLLRHPVVNAATLPLFRRIPATRIVDGVSVERIALVGRGGPLTAFLYRPERVNGDTPSPAMLYTHGGGLVMGSAEGHHELASSYARDLGMPVLSTEYRRAPEHPAPAALDDILTAYQWLQSAAKDQKIDADRIVVAGESAGAGLTAALCQRLLDEEGTQPRFQALVYPMLDDRTAAGQTPEGVGEFVWRPASNVFGWSSYLGHAPGADETVPYAAPARRSDLSGLAPAWIGVGDLDLFYGEDLAYGHRLRDVGVPCEIVTVTGAFHGFDAIKGATCVQEFRASLLRAITAAVTDPPPDAEF